jgi:transposase-like protein
MATTTPPNISALAREHGVSRNTLIRWRDEGFDLTNNKAVADRVKSMASRSGSPDLAAARLAKIEAETARIRFAHDIEKGKFVESYLIEGDGQRIGHAVRLSLDELAQQLPPQLAGRSAGEILKILRSEFRRALENLSHYKSDVKFQP